MEHLPVFLNLGDRDAVVVGGTAAAAAKARLVLAAGGRVRLIAVDLDAAFDEIHGHIRFIHLARPFRAGDAQGATVLFAATGQDGEDRIAVQAARAAGVPANAVDRPALSDFIMPAIVDRGAVTVAISSAGTAPVLARAIRRRIEALLPARLDALARFAARFRGNVGRVVADGPARRRLWEQVFEGPVGDAVLRGDEREAHAGMMALLNARSSASFPANDAGGGSVALVGAGPGDPDLLTLKALHRLERADVIVHDRLVAPAILERARRDARRIDVGKLPGSQAMNQTAINELLVALARQGLRVVRLKGGDPFIFGRGGEELDHLRRHAIPVEAIPGITAAAGCAAAARLPLTQRGLASAVTFVTGHHAGLGSETGGLDWSALAQSGATLVVYMGRANAPAIATALIDGGLDPATPLAVVENGTRPDQRILAGRLDTLAEIVAAETIDGPALIVIGAVAALADTDALNDILAAAQRAAG